MSKNCYDIVFRGEILDGFETLQVKDVFARTFAVEMPVVDRLFRRKKTTIKSRLDAKTAELYRHRFSSLGMAVDLVDQTEKPERADEVKPDVPLKQKPTSGNKIRSQSQIAVLAAQAADRAANYAVKRVLEKAPDQPVTPAAAPAADSTDFILHKSHFRFNGTGGEYFGIWIVNLLLTILTLGIYSPWAKVRSKQYFYGNTQMHGSCFEYTADPRRILLGRFIAFIFFLVFTVMSEITIVTAVISWALLILFLPWIARQSLRFNARYSSYRNVSFRFTGSLGGAFMVFVVWPILAVMTAGILFPMALHRQQHYILGNHAYGTQPFQFSGPLSDYYKMGLLLLLCSVGGGLAVFFFAVTVSVVPAVLAGMLIYIYFMAISGVYLANLKFNHMVVGGHRFEAKWTVGSYFRLILVNTLATMVTLGLFLPWARIRSAQYAAAHTQALVRGDLDRFVAAETEKPSALGEGMADIFDMDIAA